MSRRFAEFGATGSRFLEGLLAGNRFGKNQAERVLSLAAAYPRADVLSALERAVRYGAFSFQAVGRILAARGRPKTPLDALTDDHRSYIDRLLEGRRPRRDPRPTTRPCWARGPTMHNPPNPARRTSHAPKSQTARTTAASGLHGDVTGALQTLGVAVTAEALDAALSAAEKDSLSHLEFLHRLLAGPAESRLQRALERRIRDAKFRELMTLDGFDWAFNAKGVDRRTIEQGV